ncbi:MAG: tetratricopeptide repeat protein, partial [Myxococcales bacterium]|nr:tetratricopeptide repeat protein [Myxococcales bacterium]
QTWLARGRLDQARSMAERALKAEPDNQQMRQLLSQLGQG